MDRIVLIFAGKILKDEDTIETHKIKDKHTIHVVIKNKPSTSAPPPQQNRPATNTNPPASTPNTNNTGTTNNADNLFGQLCSFLDLS